MNAVTPLIIDTPIDWDAYQLTDDDLARVLSPRSLVDKAEAILHGNVQYQGATLPFAKTHDHVRLRRGKVHIWGGINSHGKTAMLKLVELGLAQQGEVVCKASLEELPEETFADLAQMSLGMWVNEQGRVREVADWLHGKLWLYDQQNMMSGNRILALMGYCVAEYHCTHFVIDGMSKLAIDLEDNEAIRGFMNRLGAYAKALNVGVHLVCHIRKPKDESQVPSMMDIKGSGAITDLADAVFVVWRNKNEDRRPDEPESILSVDKQRGRPNFVGKVKLWYEPQSRQFISNPGDGPQWFLPNHPF
jgi:twinkle protein